MLTPDPWPEYDAGPWGGRSVRASHPTLSTRQNHRQGSNVIAVLSESDKTFFGVIIVALMAPTWLAWWNARIARKQVTPNGGSSLKDQVTLLVENDKIRDAKIDLHTLQITTLTGKLDTVIENQGKPHKQVKQEREEQDEQEAASPELPPSAA